MPAVPHLLLSIGIIAIGIAVALFGYRLLRIFLVVSGFALAALAAHRVLIMADFTDPTILMIGVVIGGLLGAFLAIPLFYVGLFALGGVTGALVVHIIGMSANLPILIIAIAVAGVLAVLLRRPLIIVATALDGAWLLVFGALTLFLPSYWHTPPAGMHPAFPVTAIPPIAAWIAWAVIGLITATHQFRDTRSKQ